MHGGQQHPLMGPHAPGHGPVIGLAEGACDVVQLGTVGRTGTTDQCPVPRVPPGLPDQPGRVRGDVVQDHHARPAVVLGQDVRGLDRRKRPPPSHGHGFGRGRPPPPHRPHGLQHGYSRRIAHNLLRQDRSLKGHRPQAADSRLEQGPSMPTDRPQAQTNSDAMALPMVKAAKVTCILHTIRRLLRPRRPTHLARSRRWRSTGPQ